MSALHSHRDALLARCPAGGGAGPSTRPCRLPRFTLAPSTPASTPCHHISALSIRAYSRSGTSCGTSRPFGGAPPHHHRIPISLRARSRTSHAPPAAAPGGPGGPQSNTALADMFAYAYALQQQAEEEERKRREGLKDGLVMEGASVTIRDLTFHPPGARAGR